MGRRTLVVTHALLLAASLAGAVMTSRAADWHPFGLVVLLAALSLASDAMAIETANLVAAGCGVRGRSCGASFMISRTAMTMQSLGVPVTANRLGPY